MSLALASARALIVAAILTLTGLAPLSVSAQNKGLNETPDPEFDLVNMAGLIRQKRMGDFFTHLTKVANLNHPLKNYDKAAIEKLGQNLTNLFSARETVHYIDRVKDERYGTSLRKVVYLAYTSAGRWVYFTFVLKRGAVGWQFTRFSYNIEPIRLFPDRKK